MALEERAAGLPGTAGWVRRPWCVWLAAGLVVLGAVLNTIYLFKTGHIDLSDDEAHYWLWARHVDYGYYSKPPGIAWVFWVAERVGAALGLNGDGSGVALAPVLRMPAVIFGICTGWLSLFLARRIFRDDRAALAVILLSAAVPMFAVGSLLITIDSPMYLSWAATVFCLWRAVEARGGAEGDGRGLRSSALWLYAAGFAAALGMLFKPVLIALPLCAVIAAMADRQGAIPKTTASRSWFAEWIARNFGVERGGPIRRAFFTRHGAVALVILLLSQVPTIVWNANHGWVTYRHILTQGGIGAQAGATPKPLIQTLLLSPLARIGEYVGGQAAGMGGVMFVLLVIAVWAAMGKVRGLRREPTREVIAGERTRWVFLLSFALPLWLFYFLLNIRKGTELNWPAASYFTGMILLAGIFVEGWNAADLRHRKVWRSWGTGAIIFGIVMTSLPLNARRVYPYIAERLRPLEGTEAYGKSFWNPRKWDQPTAGKLRGMRERAAVVDQALAEFRANTGQEPMLIGRRYGISSSLSFYMKDHPFVYSIMSNAGERLSQYDLWPGVNEKDADGKLIHAGRSALIIATDADGNTRRLLEEAFERVEPAEKLPVRVDGVILRDIAIYKAHGFRGMPVPSSGRLY